MNSQGAPTDATAQAERLGAWLPVAVAAARLGISERTVQRRAQSGKIEARQVLDEQGKRWLIRVDLPTSNDNLPTPTHVQVGEAADTFASPADKLATPADRGADTSFAGHLLEENRFLRSIIEQLQRDGAETRLALRRALELAPRQLLPPGGTSGATSQGKPEAPSATEMNSGHGQKTAPQGANLSYGDIADMIEQELSR